MTVLLYTILLLFCEKECNRRTICGGNFATNMPQRNRMSLEHREKIVRTFEDENEDDTCSDA